MYWLYLLALIIFFFILYIIFVLLESGRYNAKSLTLMLLILFYLQLSCLYWEQPVMLSYYLIFLKFGIFALYLFFNYSSYRLSVYHVSLIFFLLISTALLFVYVNLILFFILIELFSLFLIFFLLFSKTHVEDKKVSMLSFLLLNMIYLVVVLILFQYLVYTYNNANINFIYMMMGTKKSILALFITILLLIKIAGGPLVFWNRFVYKNINLVDLFWYSFFNLLVILSHLLLVTFFNLTNHFSLLCLLVLLSTLSIISSRPGNVFDILLVSFYVFIVLLICMF